MNKGQRGKSALHTPDGAKIRKLRENKRLSRDDLVAMSRCKDFEGDAFSKSKLEKIELKNDHTKTSIMKSLANILEVKGGINELTYSIGDAAKHLVTELYIKRDLNALDLNRDRISDNVVFEITGHRETISFAGTYHGFAGMDEFFEKYFDRVEFERRATDPLPTLEDAFEDPSASRVVLNLHNDIVRLRANPNRFLVCKVQLTFAFEDQKLVYFHDFLDTGAWEKFLSRQDSEHVIGSGNWQLPPASK